MTEIKRIVTNPRRGRAVVYNGLLFIGGQTASDKSQDIRGQMRDTLSKVDRVLAEAGTDKDHLLSAQIWLKDIERDFGGMNEVWDSWINAEHAPSRATCQCAMASQGTLVEVILTAAISRDGLHG